VRAAPLVVATALGLAVGPAAAYRPFESTDADVVALREIEVELGVVGFRREQGRTQVVSPSLVVDVGLLERVEAIGEGKVTYEQGRSARLEDAALGLKWLARAGSLQGVGTGPSLAVEALALLPSAPGEHHVGGVIVGIASVERAGFLAHVNAGALVDRSSKPGALWGLIVERMLDERLRAAIEVNGEIVPGEPAEVSGLLGAIWQVELRTPLGSLSLALDAGIRRGFSAGAPDWEGTLGLTVPFSW
jgi:hypothetical protein